MGSQREIIVLIGSISIESQHSRDSFLLLLNLLLNLLVRILVGRSDELLHFDSTPSSRKKLLLRERKKGIPALSLSSRLHHTTNSQNVVVKGQGSRIEHDGGHPQEDAADEEGEGGVRRQSRAGRGEDEGAPRKPQGARRRDQLFEQKDPTS